MKTYEIQDITCPEFPKLSVEIHDDGWVHLKQGQPTHTVYTVIALDPLDVRMLRKILAKVKR